MIIAMTKRDQIDLIAGMAGITPAQARMAIDGVAAIISAGLEAEGEFSYHGLGRFVTRRRSSRRLNNPATGIMMDVPARTVVQFRPSPDLRRRVEEAHP